MLPPPFQDALVLAGPTASGKSSLALELADPLNAEIISMDSMSLYRGMDIGTAKPSRADRERVPHHLIDVLDPWKSASVAWWLKQAEAAVRDIASRGKLPLIVGGTPLYLKALVAGLFEGPPADPVIRSRLETEAASDPSVLHARLADVDPVSGTKLHPNDVRRIIRALEVYETTGKPISAWQQQWTQAAPSDDGISIVWLDVPRAKLHERIDRRVEAMFEEGWEAEVRQLRALPQPLSKEASQALGYKEWIAVMDGKLSRADAVRQIQARTRQFAKRQVTWFRHLPGCRPATPQLTRDLWHSRMRQTLREQ
ncbi:MAG: tRNA (adenosine(37)-N6)-dimethylallyltransferase MiaA [Gemmataceae bacterium]|nr:tRNA (adenosine(37)-N6)-dimethylallyltransferase MiaA [Gemmataceae bacterium]